MSIMLLEDVVDEMMVAARQGNRSRVAALLYRTVYERAGVMHDRAQRAEGRAVQAEKLLRRMSERVGFVVPE